MKNAIVLLLLVLPCLHSNAQDQSLNIEISRGNFSEIQVVNQNEKFIITEVGDALVSLRNTFTIIEGKGATKDANGIRERQKNYLIDGRGDTLATIINSLEMIVIEDQVIHIKKEMSNWAYSLAATSDTLAISTLMWNKEKWQYELQFEQNNGLTEILKKYILLTMVDSAKKESATDCDDGMETFWMIMYASTLAQ